MLATRTSIASAPRPLVLACLIPPLQFLFGAINNFDLVLLALLLASSVLAFIGLTGPRFSRRIVMTTLAALVVLNAFIAYHAHYPFFSNVRLFEAHEWHSESARRLLWPFAMSMVFLALNLGALWYVLVSKKVRSFYRAEHSST